MALTPGWTVTFDQNTELPGVGAIYAKYVPLDGISKPLEFPLPRVDTNNLPAMQVLVSQGKAAAVAWEAQLTANKAITSAIVAALNS